MRPDLRTELQSLAPLDQSDVIDVRVGVSIFASPFRYVLFHFGLGSYLAYHSPLQREALIEAQRRYFIRGHRDGAGEHNANLFTRKTTS
jgi:hypothetical protein